MLTSEVNQESWLVRSYTHKMADLMTEGELEIPFATGSAGKVDPVSWRIVCERALCQQD